MKKVLSLSMLLLAFVACQKSVPVELAVSECQTEWDFAGGTTKLAIDCNYPWTAVAESPLTLSKSQGLEGLTTITITVPANTSKEELEPSIVITAVGNTDQKVVTIDFSIMAAYLSYGGVDYKLAKLKDGNIWMAENLRYVPAGITVSSSLTNVTAGVYYPIVYDGTGAAFSTKQSDIEKNGLLYQTETALGLSVGGITTEAQAKALEGCQGICPEGWHIPTISDIIGLVGKAVSPIATKTDAPYYNGIDGSIALLNQDKFNIAAYGAVTIQDATKTAATLMGYLTKFPGRISSGYLCGSSYAGITYIKDGDVTSGVKNVQFYGFMPMTNKATESEYTFNGSKLSYRIGATVRCVKNAK